MLRASTRLNGRAAATACVFAVSVVSAKLQLPSTIRVAPRQSWRCGSDCPRQALYRVSCGAGGAAENVQSCMFLAGDAPASWARRLRYGGRPGHPGAEQNYWRTVVHDSGKMEQRKDTVMRTMEAVPTQ